MMQCCNPECQAPFNHREGRLVRISRPTDNQDSFGDQSVLQHFWLCGKCAVLFKFDRKSGVGVRMKQRDAASSKENLSPSASAA